MPFSVLKCFKCRTFQIHPQTKASKWRCKMCNEKQSFLKVFMMGTAPECRQTVQRLNRRQGEIEEEEKNFQASRIEPQAGNTHIAFCPAGFEQVYETQHVAEGLRLTVQQPLTSRSNPTAAWNSSCNSGGEEVTTRLSDPIHRSSRLQTQAPGLKRPLAFRAASSLQEESPAGSKWSKFLDPTDGADDSSSSSSEEDVCSGNIKASYTCL